jgi:hypothetical protein
MQNLNIASAARTPEITLDLTSLTCAIVGESYPEDTVKFYGAVLPAIFEFLETKHTSPVVFIFNLQYFNSSSAKILIDLFHALESSAKLGNTVNVQWHYITDDDNMKELGEEFSEELKVAHFALVEV